MARVGLPALRGLESLHEEVAFNQRPQVRKGQGSLHTEWQRESQKAPRRGGSQDVVTFEQACGLLWWQAAMA